MTEASASVGLLLATALIRSMHLISLHFSDISRSSLPTSRVESLERNRLDFKEIGRE